MQPLCVSRAHGHTSLMIPDSVRMERIERDCRYPRSSFCFPHTVKGHWGR
jgi:hypothetical protein